MPVGRFDVYLCAMRRLPIVLTLGAVLLPATVAAQGPAPSLTRLSFLSGCWQGSAGPAATMEERYTAPTANIMLGTSRTIEAGRTTSFEFLLIEADTAGIALTPFPGGARSKDVFRLTRLDDTLAVFEAPQHDYPKRIVYRRTGEGSLVARIDSGSADPAPHEWRLNAAVCGPAPQLAGLPPGQARAAIRGPDRSGRVQLFVGETLNGLWLGVAIPAMFGANSAAPYGLGLLLGAPSGILFAKAVNDARPVSTGQARAILWGGEWGWWQGLGWASALTSDLSGRGFFASTVGGMVGGTLVGLAVSAHPISAGDASLVTHSSAWGTWISAAAGALANVDGDAELELTLIGGDAALLAGALATKHVEMSAGRVWLVTAAGIAGGFAGLGIDLLVQPSGRGWIAVPLGTSIAGLVTGFQLTRHFDDGRLAAADASTMPGGAVLSVREGRLGVNLPMPQPALVPRDDHGVRRWVPGVRLTIFEMRH